MIVSTSREECRIAVSVEHPDARELSLEAIRHFGNVPIPLDRPADLPGVSRVCVGSVCDLARPKTMASAIQSIREIQPAHPIVLIGLPGQDMGLRQAIRDDMGVQWCMGDADRMMMPCLLAGIEWMMKYHPVDSLLQTMLEAVQSPSSTSARFIEWAIRAVHGCTSPSVTTGARDLSMSSRTLARHLHDDHLPPPIELYGWARLLSVSHRADLNHTSLAAAARTFHMESGRLYQLRRRLLRKTSVPQDRTDHLVFDVVLLAFRERCETLQGEAEPTS